MRVIQVNLFRGVIKKEKHTQWPIKYIQMSKQFAPDAVFLIEQQESLFSRQF